MPVVTSAAILGAGTLSRMSVLLATTNTQSAADLQIYKTTSATVSTTKHRPNLIPNPHGHDGAQRLSHWLHSFSDLIHEMS